MWLDWMPSSGNGRKEYLSSFLGTPDLVGTLPLKLETDFYKTLFQMTQTLNWMNFQLNWVGVSTDTIALQY